MVTERFWHLISRKLANEAKAAELKELEKLVQENPGLADFFKSVVESTPFPVDEESIEAEQAFALHSIRLHLSKDDETLLTKEPFTFEQVENASGNENQHNLYRPYKRRTYLKRVFLLLVFATLAFGVFLFKNIGNSVNVQNTVEVPAGQRVKLILPDSSVVWLNSKSKFTYPSSFSGKERKVTLEGEAFFDVTHNLNRPFTVVTPSHTINVLGTVFNVSAYRNSNSFEATLVSGSVKVREVARPLQVAVLKPGESFSFNRIEVASSIEKVDAQKYTSWKDGLYQFNHLPLGEIINRLGDYKGVNIVVKDSSILNSSYTVKFRQEESITEIMQVLKSDIHFDYDYNAQSNTLVIH